MHLAIRARHGATLRTLDRLGLRFGQRNAGAENALPGREWKFIVGERTMSAAEGSPIDFFIDWDGKLRPIDQLALSDQTESSGR